MNTNYSALPLTSPSIELQSNGAKSSAVANGVLNGHAKISKQDSFLGEVEDGSGVEHDELPLIGHGPAGPPEGSSVHAAVFNLATSIIGAGIMALPATMKVLGVAVGLVSILVMGVLSEITIELLVRFSAYCGALSYGEVVHRALGRPASILAQMCVIINNAGVLVVYLIIIGDVMSGSLKHIGVVDQLIGHGEWDNRRLLILVVLVIFLAPLCALEKIDSLSLSSAASVALAVVFVVVSCIIALIKIAEGKINMPRMGPDFSSRAAMLDLLVVIPIMTNAYICHFNVQPIYNELKEKTPQNMCKIGRISTVLCVVVYALTAISGYLLFGDDTESDVLTNFDKDLGIRFSSVLNYIVRIGYIIHLVLVFPVVHFSLRQTVDSLIFGELATPSRKKTLTLTVVLLALIYLGSTMIPNIWMAFKFTGATTGLALGFMFPALVSLRLDKEGSRLGHGERLLSLCLLGLAIIVSVIGVAGNVYTLKSKSD
ncbi:amino acid transporter AVT6E-like [Phragmites australis]|uniref:amino acid transporter AVT6E-like n=1 Tax=Phragmites australis TaxID=29695 RepID=UPI002D7706DB|nr:amino acid transporter AVT6E-like [Phragmites australis]